MPLNQNLIAADSILISATPDQVWDVLTNPEKIKVYLFGTETITDWQAGSPIIFQGEYEGTQYKDKGFVIENKSSKILKYGYWSGFSGLIDSKENYATITYSLEKQADNSTKFTWHQRGFSSEEGQQHSQSGMQGLLEQIKTLAEISA